MAGSDKRNKSARVGRIITLQSVIFTLLLATAAVASAQTPTPPLSELYIDVGKSFEDAAQPAKAAEYYLKALEADPTNINALNALQTVLQQQRSSDPRLPIAEQYFSARQYDNAVELYLQILADRPAQPDIQQRTLAAIDAARSVRSQLEPDTITAGKAVLFAILTLLGLLTLFLLARLIRRFRQRRVDKTVRRYVLLPFTNATGVQSLAGVQDGVRAAMGDWLHAWHAADVRVEVHDSALVAEATDLPDVGVVATLANWFLAQITPNPDASFVDGTLLGVRLGTSGQEAGLTVRVRAQKSGQIDRVRTFWCQTSVASDPNAYVQLAQSGASWVYDPAKVMQCGPAGILHQANTLVVWSISLKDVDKPAARSVMIEAIRLAQLADAEEGALARPPAAGSLAAGSTKRASTIITPSALPAQRAVLYQQFLDQMK